MTSNGFCFIIARFTILLIIVGGCAHVPEVDRHFKRHHAHETVRYFRYAIDAGQYEAAYRCLSASSQTQVSPLAFEAMLRFIDVPELGGIGLRCMLVDSTVDSRAEVVEAGQPQRWVTLVWSSEESYIEYSLFLQPNEDDQWEIDLLAIRGVDLSGGP